MRAAAELFDKSPLPFGICEVTLNSDGTPSDAVFTYLNPALASVTDHTPEQLVGVGMYDLWGGDTAWLESYYRSAHLGEVVEFESTTELLESFEHMTIFPIRLGYCGFVIQDISEWVSPVHPSMSNAESGLFFYDMRTHRMLLTSSAQALSGADRAYTTLIDFTNHVFGPQAVDAIRDQMEDFRANRGGVYLEGQRGDGRWLRLSLDHAGKANSFAYGLLEDFTRTREAELANDRYFSIVESLSRENFALYLVDLATDSIEPFHLRTAMDGSMEGVVLPSPRYSESMKVYVDEYVAPADRETVRAEVNPQAVHARFQAGIEEFSRNYRRIKDGDEQYVEMRMIRLLDGQDKFVLAARNTTQEMHDQLRQRNALTSALELAEHASSAKSTFLTNMSHDFRTPMNSISGFAGIALDHLDDTDRVRDCLRKIMISSDHLLNLVNDILDVSRIESGKVSLSEELIDLRDLMVDIEQMFADKAREDGLNFTVEVDDLQSPCVMSDRLRLDQIIVNIVGNALKFTSEGGAVHVSLREWDGAQGEFGSYVLEVSDTGCGMGPEFLEHLFDPFERDNLGSASKVEGTGLGMTITKSLVDLLGGTIDVKSIPRCGTTFTVRLPLRRANDEETAAAKEGVPDIAIQRDFSGCRVLVVDDDDLSREILVEILKDYGFMTDEAHDGDTAIRKVEESPAFYFDAVLMDMRMPRMDGDEATRVIRALDRPDAATLPIIAETADAFEEGHRRARDAGMTALTTKPLNTRALMELLAKYIPEKQSS